MEAASRKKGWTVTDAESLLMTGMVQCFSRKRMSNVHRSPKQLPCPDGWEVMQINGSVWIVEHNKRSDRLDAAQYGMLLARYSALRKQSI